MPGLVLTVPASLRSCLQSAWPLTSAHISAVSPRCESEPPPPHIQLQRYDTGDTKQKKKQTKIQNRAQTEETQYGATEKPRPTTHIILGLFVGTGIEQRNSNPETHNVLGLFVGTGIEQQPHTVRMALHSGPYQRSVSILRIADAVACTTPAKSHTHHKFKKKGSKKEEAQRESEIGKQQPEDAQCSWPLCQLRHRAAAAHSLFGSS